MLSIAAVIDHDGTANTTIIDASCGKAHISTAAAQAALNRAIVTANFLPSTQGVRAVVCDRHVQLQLPIGTRMIYCVYHDIAVLLSFILHQQKDNLRLLLVFPFLSPFIAPILVCTARTYEVLIATFRDVISTGVIEILLNIVNNYPALTPNPTAQQLAALAATRDTCGLFRVLANILRLSDLNLSDGNLLQWRNCITNLGQYPEVANLKVTLKQHHSLAGSTGIGHRPRDLSLRSHYNLRGAYAPAISATMLAFADLVTDAAENGAVIQGRSGYGDSLLTFQPFPANIELPHFSSLPHEPVIPIPHAAALTAQQNLLLTILIAASPSLQLQPRQLVEQTFLICNAAVQFPATTDLFENPRIVQLAQVIRSIILIFPM